MTSSTDPAIEIVDNPDKHRYEVREADGSVVGFTTYRRSPGTIVFIHTEVDPSQEGKGVGSRLARGALDDVRRLGLKAVTKCEFMSAYVARHDEYADLVRDEAS